MTDEKPKPNLRATKHWQKAAARSEYLHHPDASIAEVAQATGVAVRTVARARAALVAEGLLPAGRNAAVSAADALTMTAAGLHLPLEPAPRAEAPAAAPPPPAHSTIDGEAMRKLGEMMDEIADEDDDKTRERMLRQVKRFAFDPDLHPDTRMSASTLWAKLSDMKRAKDLGPGVPMTFDAAVSRATDFLLACGIKVAVAAFCRAFNITLEAPSGEVPAQPTEAPPGAPPSTP